MGVCGCRCNVRRGWRPAGGLDGWSGVVRTWLGAGALVRVDHAQPTVLVRHAQDVAAPSPGAVARAKRRHWPSVHIREGVLVRAVTGQLGEQRRGGDCASGAS